MLTQFLFGIDLRGKFNAIHREYSPNPRKFYSFCTSVTDTVTTSGIIASGKSIRRFIAFLDDFVKRSRLGSARYGHSTASEAVETAITCALLLLAAASAPSFTIMQRSFFFGRM